RAHRQGGDSEWQRPARGQRDRCHRRHRDGRLPLQGALRGARAGHSDAARGLRGRTRTRGSPEEDDPTIALTARSLVVPRASRLPGAPEKRTPCPTCEICPEVVAEGDSVHIGETVVKKETWNGLEKHARCDILEGPKDDERVWLPCSCGARVELRPGSTPPTS